MDSEIAYRAPATWFMWPGALAIFGAAGLVTLFVSILNRGPWLFTLGFLAAISWMGYNVLRAAYEIKVGSGLLTWRSFVGHGQIRLSDIKSVRSLYSGSVQEYRCANGQGFRVTVGQGYQPFVEAFRRAHPELPLVDSRYAKFVNKLQFPRSGAEGRSSSEKDS